jgi:hypothetical protein
LSRALFVAGKFGFTDGFLPWLIRLTREDWHTLHERIVFALAARQSAAAVAALRAMAWRVPAYLAWDDNRALAVKAVHALGAVRCPEAVTALREVADKAEDDPARAEARRQLEDPDWSHTEYMARRAREWWSDVA